MLGRTRRAASEGTTPVARRSMITFLQEYGFSSLKEVDLGDNVRLGNPMVSQPIGLERIRLDVDFPQQDIVIQQRKRPPQGDIFHNKRLIFRSAYVCRSITSETFE